MDVESDIFDNISLRSLYNAGYVPKDIVFMEGCSICAIINFDYKGYPERVYKNRFGTMIERVPVLKIWVHEDTIMGWAHLRPLPQRQFGPFLPEVTYDKHFISDDETIQMYLDMLETPEVHKGNRNKQSEFSKQVQPNDKDKTLSQLMKDKVLTLINPPYDGHAERLKFEWHD